MFYCPHCKASVARIGDTCSCKVDWFAEEKRAVRAAAAYQTAPANFDVVDRLGFERAARKFIAAYFRARLGGPYAPELVQQICKAIGE
jgi:hypothetical protein